MSVDAELARRWRASLDGGLALWWGPQAATMHCWRVGRWYYAGGGALEGGRLIDARDGNALAALFDAHALDTLASEEGRLDPQRVRDPLLDAGVSLEIFLDGFWSETSTLTLQPDGRVLVGRQLVCNDGSGVGGAGESELLAGADAAEAYVRERVARRGVPDVVPNRR